jgi:hypothetical protein
MARVLLAFAVIVLVAGCGGEIDPARTPAGSAQVRFLENIYNGRYAQAYTELHPAYQRLVSKGRFVSCTRQLGLGGLDSVEVLDVYDDPVRVPEAGEVKAKAVRVRLIPTTGTAPAPLVNHEVKVGSQWRWVLNQEWAGAYTANRCPAA